MADDDIKKEDFDDEDEIHLPKQIRVGYNQIVDSLFSPKNYLDRVEMSIMPQGNRAYKMALVIARQRVKQAVINGEDYDVEEILIDSYARVKRAEKGWLGEKGVEMKALETDKENQPIHQMSGE